MLEGIRPVSPSPVGSVLLTPIEPQLPKPEVGGTTFRSSLGNLVSEVNQVQHEASDAIQRFATGNGENLHEVMIAVSKAELSFKFLMEARNKLVDAYHEVMRMQL